MQMEFVKEVIKELIRLNTLPLREQFKGDDVFPLPRMIDAGNGKSLIVSEKMDADIAQFANFLMDAEPSIKPKINRPEWGDVVRSAFGPILASIDLEDELETNVATVLDQVKSAVYQYVSGQSSREHVFGCTLFTGDTYEPFSFGPVRFEPRDKWLERKYMEGLISPVSLRRVKRIWQGDKLRKRKAPSDKNAESSILRTIGKSPFVCSVTTQRLAPEASLEKALIAARFATTLIALTWQMPSQALARMNLNYDRIPHHRHTLIFLPNRPARFTMNWSYIPSGPHILKSHWDGILRDWAKVFSVAADLLVYVTSPDSDVKRPNMMSTLFHAFMWFHEGCRASLTHQAIVCFAASLDALACGKKAKGIEELIRARLKLGCNDPIRPNGPTVRKTVQRIYGDGRSRSIHGNNAEVNSDWSDIKAVAEQLARWCLLLCMDWAANNPICDDPSQFRLSQQ
jgi:hypothetical protein